MRSTFGRRRFLQAFADAPNRRVEPELHNCAGLSQPPSAACAQCIGEPPQFFRLPGDQEPLFVVRKQPLAGHLAAGDRDRETGSWSLRSPNLLGAETLSCILFAYFFSACAQ